MKQLIKHEMKKSDLTAESIKNGGVLIHTLIEVGQEFVSSIVIAKSETGYRVGFKQHKTGKVIKKVNAGTLAEVKKIVFAA